MRVITNKKGKPRPDVPTISYFVASHVNRSLHLKILLSSNIRQVKVSSYMYHYLLDLLAGWAGRQRLCEIADIWASDDKWSKYGLPIADIHKCYDVRAIQHSDGICFSHLLVNFKSVGMSVRHTFIFVLMIHSTGMNQMKSFHQRHHNLVICISLSTRSVSVSRLNQNNQFEIDGLININDAGIDGSIDWMDLGSLSGLIIKLLFSLTQWSGARKNSHEQKFDINNNA